VGGYERFDDRQPFGVYWLVWYYKINREAPRLGIRVSPLASLLAVTLGVFVIVPPFVSLYQTGDRIARMQRAAGLAPTCSPVAGLLLMVLLFGSGTPVTVEATTWPGVPLASWPAATPDKESRSSPAGFVPPRGRGIRIIPDGVSLAGVKCQLLSSRVGPGPSTGACKHRAG
jgi:hypothetical protein